MKKYIKCMLFITFFCILIFFTNKVQALSGSTVFIGEPVVLENYENIEITYNNVEINEETSKVKNIQIFTNLSDKELIKKASIKLEDSYYNITINSLKILVNDLEIKEIVKNGDSYEFYFRIPPNEAKKIEISYQTDNSLQNAKIIKYTMDKIKGQKVKLFQINVLLSKYDIPLVQKIWPGAYEFENNTVSTEYFDFAVNNLTSSFIIQKETYKNLKYGENSESLSEIDEYILKNAKDFIDGKMPEILYDLRSSDYYGTRNIITKCMSGREYDYQNDTVNKSLITVFEYALINKLNSQNKVYNTDEYGNKYSVFNYNNSEDYCLAHIIISLYTKETVWGEYDEKGAAGKTVAINYYETEQGKDLYVNKDIKNLSHSVDGAEFVLTKRDEYSILRTIVAEGAPVTYLNEGIKRVFVNSDIDGNKIDVTEEEILQFVNMMNVDLYIRIVLYDPSSQSPDVLVGYYTEDSKQIAMEYIETDVRINKIKESIEEIKNDTYYSQSEEVKQERINSNIEWIENINKSYKMFDNIEVKNNSKVPTIAHCVGKSINSDGKYVIEFNNTSDFSGLFYIYGATECETAQNMLKVNKANNIKIKNEIINKINSTKISRDYEEYIKSDDSINLENTQNENNSTEAYNFIGISKENILTIVLSILIIICIIILFVMLPRRNKNGRK